MPDRRFILRWAFCLVLFAAIWTGLFYLQFGAPTAISGRVKGVIDLKRQAAAAPGPKVILVGGSSVWESLHAEALEKELGVPVVNFGLTIGLGPDYLLHEVRRSIHPGDTVVLVLEYEQFSDLALRNEVVTDYAVAEDCAYFNALPWRTRAAWILGFPWKRLQKGLESRWHHGPHLTEKDAKQASTRQTNRWGDFTENHLAERDPGQLEFVRRYRAPDYYRTLEAHAAIWRLVREFHAWCQANGVRLVVAYPPYFNDVPPATEFDRLYARIATFYAQEGIEAVGTPQEMLHPREAFFDSPYHLTYEAAEAHTAAFAALLRQHGIGAAEKNSPSPADKRPDSAK